MITSMRKTAAILAAGGALSVVGVAAPALGANAPGPVGQGTSLCHAVPAGFSDGPVAPITQPAGGPGYNFITAPPASGQAFVIAGCPFPG